MTDTDTKMTFGPEEVAAYLGDTVVTDDHDLSTITTCLKVIGRYPTENELRDPAIIEAAVEGLASWMEDNGVLIELIDIAGINGK